ncbi:MAG: dephospho-CoA kinase [Lachnospiraceae bacterium]|uniref:dephospho-CoA kinase n=1 Tax=Candidatus Merdisoma sp. JLR.KK006 TaxID=3112626 RepID=UPI002FF018F1|nr:dephospho-CoA kinase [Lachnospiraceae bacterium]
MRVIGITGGVGAGKSRLLSFLEEAYKAQVFQADQAGHQVMEPGTDAYGQIVEYFGKGILAADGRIDRQALGAQVFSDEKKRKYLNGIIHPAVKALARKEIAKARSEGGIRLFIIEAALLIEDHYEEICDELWYVYADEAVRRERLRVSRSYTDEKTTAVFESQLADEEFRKHCQVVIDNSGTIEAACEQIRVLLQKKI